MFEETPVISTWDKLRMVRLNTLAKLNHSNSHQGVILEHGLQLYHRLPYPCSIKGVVHSSNRVEETFASYFAYNEEQDQVDFWTFQLEKKTPTHPTLSVILDCTIRKLVYISKSKVYVALCQDMKLRLYSDVRTGFKKLACASCSNSIFCIAYSEELYMGCTGKIEIWRIFGTEHSAVIQKTGKFEISFSPDVHVVGMSVDKKNKAVFALCDAGIIVISSETNHQLMFVPAVQGAAFSCCAYYKTKEYLFTGSSDGTIRVWNCVNIQCIKMSHGHKGTITALKLKLKDKLLYSASLEGSIDVWQVNTFQHLSQYSFAEKVQDIKIIGNSMLICLLESEVVVYRLNDFAKIYASTKSKICKINCQQETYLSDRILVSTEDGSLKMLCPSTGDTLTTIQPLPLHVFDNYIYIRDKDKLYTVLQTGDVITYNCCTNPCTAAEWWKPDLKNDCILALTYLHLTIKESSCDCKEDFLVFAGLKSGQILLVEADTCTMTNYQNGHSLPILCLEVAKKMDLAKLSSHHLQLLVSAGADREVRLWEILINNPINYLAVIKNTICVVHGGNILKLFRVASGSSSSASAHVQASLTDTDVEPELLHGEDITSLDKCSSLEIFATSCEGGYLKIWSCYGEILRELHFEHPVFGMGFANSRGDILIGQRSNVCCISFVGCLPEKNLEKISEMDLNDDKQEDNESYNPNAVLCSDHDKVLKGNVNSENGPKDWKSITIPELMKYKGTKLRRWIWFLSISRLVSMKTDSSKRRWPGIRSGLAAGLRKLTAGSMPEKYDKPGHFSDKLYKDLSDTKQTDDFPLQAISVDPAKERFEKVMKQYLKEETMNEEVYCVFYDSKVWLKKLKWSTVHLPMALDGELPNSVIRKLLFKKKSETALDKSDLKKEYKTIVPDINIMKDKIAKNWTWDTRSGMKPLSSLKHKVAPKPKVPREKREQLLLTPLLSPTPSQTPLSSISSLTSEIEEALKRKQSTDTSPRESDDKKRESFLRVIDLPVTINPEEIPDLELPDIIKKLFLEPWFLKGIGKNYDDIMDALMMLLHEKDMQLHENVCKYIGRIHKAIELPSEKCDQIIDILLNQLETYEDLYKINCLKLMEIIKTPRTNSILEMFSNMADNQKRADKKKISSQIDVENKEIMKVHDIDSLRPKVTKMADKKKISSQIDVENKEIMKVHDIDSLRPKVTKRADKKKISSQIDVENKEIMKVHDIDSLRPKVTESPLSDLDKRISTTISTVHEVNQQKEVNRQKETDKKKRLPLTEKSHMGGPGLRRRKKMIINPKSESFYSYYSDRKELERKSQSKSTDPALIRKPLNIEKYRTFMSRIGRINEVDRFSDFMKMDTFKDDHFQDYIPGVHPGEEESQKETSGDKEREKARGKKGSKIDHKRTVSPINKIGENFVQGAEDESKDKMKATKKKFKTLSSGETAIHTAKDISKSDKEPGDDLLFPVITKDKKDKILDDLSGRGRQPCDTLEYLVIKKDRKDERLEDRASMDKKPCDILKDSAIVKDRKDERLEDRASMDRKPFDTLKDSAIAKDREDVRPEDRASMDKKPCDAAITKDRKDERLEDRASMDRKPFDTLKDSAIAKDREDVRPEDRASMDRKPCDAAITKDRKDERLEDRASMDRKPFDSLKDSAIAKDREDVRPEDRASMDKKPCDVLKDSAITKDRKDERPEDRASMDKKPCDVLKDSAITKDRKDERLEDRASMDEKPCDVLKDSTIAKDRKNEGLDDLAGRDKEPAFKNLFSTKDEMLDDLEKCQETKKKEERKSKADRRIFESSQEIPKIDQYSNLRLDHDVKIRMDDETAFSRSSEKQRSTSKLPNVHLQSKRPIWIRKTVSDNYQSCILEWSQGRVEKTDEYPNIESSSKVPNLSESLKVLTFKLCSEKMLKEMQEKKRDINQQDSHLSSTPVKAKELTLSMFRSLPDKDTEDFTSSLNPLQVVSLKPTMLEDFELKLKSLQTNLDEAADKKDKEASKEEKDGLLTSSPKISHRKSKKQLKQPSKKDQKKRFLQNYLYTIKYDSEKLSAPMSLKAFRNVSDRAVTEETGPLYGSQQMSVLSAPSDQPKESILVSQLSQKPVQPSDEPLQPAFPSVSQKSLQSVVAVASHRKPVPAESTVLEDSELLYLQKPGKEISAPPKESWRKLFHHPIAQKKRRQLSIPKEELSCSLSTIFCQSQDGNEVVKTELGNRFLDKVKLSKKNISRYIDRHYIEALPARCGIFTVKNGTGCNWYGMIQMVWQTCLPTSQLTTDVPCSLEKKKRKPGKMTDTCLRSEDLKQYANPPLQLYDWDHPIPPPPPALSISIEDVRKRQLKYFQTAYLNL